MTHTLRTVKSDRGLVYFTFPIVALIIVTSCVGIFYPDIYARETIDWRAQTIGQDFSNLLVTVPALIIATLFATNGSGIGKIVWAGVMITNVYAFMIYSFAIPFNFLFHVYCAILGLSVFSVIYFYLHYVSSDFQGWFNERIPVKTVGIFLIVVASLFTLLWLSQSIPSAVGNRVPESVSKDGLLTNPVHVLDFSFYLPLLFISAISLLRKKAIGYLIAPVMIVSSIMTNINILSLMIASMFLMGSDTRPMILAFASFTVICFGFLWAVLRCRTDDPTEPI